MENELTEHGSASLSQVLDAAAQLAPSSASSGVTQNINTGNGTQIGTVNDGVTIADGTIINGGLSFGDGATVNVFNGITPESLLALLPMLQKMFGIKPNCELPEKLSLEIDFFTFYVRFRTYLVNIKKYSLSRYTYCPQHREIINSRLSVGISHLFLSNWMIYSEFDGIQNNFDSRVKTAGSSQCAGLHGAS